MTEIPAIGRIVHYQPTGEGANPRAAIITAVDEKDKTLSLTVFHPAVMTQLLRVHHSEAPKPGCWNWPPRG